MAIICADITETVPYDGDAVLRAGYTSVNDIVIRPIAEHNGRSVRIDAHTVGLHADITLTADEAVVFARRILGAAGVEGGRCFLDVEGIEYDRTDIYQQGDLCRAARFNGEACYRHVSK